jgi:hypothetical protein
MLRRLVTSLALLCCLHGPVTSLGAVDDPSSNKGPRLEQIVAESSPLKIEPKQVYLVSQIVGQDDFADQTPKYATVGQEVKLHVVLEAREGEKTVYYTTAPKVKIKGKEISPAQVKTWPLNGTQPKIEIVKVQPDPQETSYVYPDGNDHSFNHVQYEEIPFEKGWSTPADVHFNNQFPQVKRGLGVMHYSVNLKYGNQELSSPGKESIELGGISDKVIRVSFRPNTGSWVDYLFELFNTPYIWGSVPKQVDSQVGSDCADLVLYGWRRAGHADLEYTWSDGLRSGKYTHFVVDVDEWNVNGIKDLKGRDIKFGETVREGDLLSFFRHVGVLYKDNGNGILDCDDLMIHVLGDFPKIEGICDAFGVPSQVLRWKSLPKN